MRYGLVACGGGFVLLAVIFTLQNRQDIDSEELARRCATSRPAWNGYQEDIKEIGARPVAAWHGRPASARVSHPAIWVSFELTPPWSMWRAALPILLKTPEGAVLQSVRSERDGPIRRYYFELPPDAGITTPPWLEVQYPHTRMRILLSEDGRWEAPSTASLPENDVSTP